MSSHAPTAVARSRSSPFSPMTPWPGASSLTSASTRGAAGRAHRSVARIEIERRHREHLTGLVEALQDRAAGIPPEPDVPVVEVVIQSVGTGGFRQ